MSAFQQKYTVEQKAAVTEAWLERGIRPYRHVQALAKAGQLTLRGTRVDPFDMPISTMTGLIRDERKRRAGKVESPFGNVSPLDAVDALRLDLLGVADAEIRWLKRQRTGKRDPDRMRQIARVLREIAALPGAKDGRAHQPGQRDPATQRQNEGRTRNGLAGAIIAASRSNGEREAEPAPEPLTDQPTPAENGTSRTATRPDDSGESTQDAAPGSAQRVPATSRSVLLAARP